MSIRMVRRPFLCLVLTGVMTLSSVSSYQELYAQELWNSDKAGTTADITYDEGKDLGPQTYYNVKRKFYSKIEHGNYTLFNYHDKITRYDRSRYERQIRAAQAMNAAREQYVPAEWGRLSASALRHRQADTDLALQFEYERRLVAKEKRIASLKRGQEASEAAEQRRLEKIAKTRADRYAQKAEREERKRVALGLSSGETKTYSAKSTSTNTSSGNGRVTKVHSNTTTNKPRRLFNQYD